MPSSFRLRPRWLCVTLLLLLGCAEEPGAPRGGIDEAEAPSDTERSVVVALAPTAEWLIGRVAGPQTEVVGVWPEPSSSLDEQQLATVASARLVVRHGATFDGWSNVLDLPNDRLVDLSDGLELIEREGTRHSHGDEGEHTHAEPLADTWLDPALTLAALERLEPRLRTLGPGRVDDADLASLRRSLERISQGLDALSERTGPVSSPDSLAYLARRLEGTASDSALTLVAEARESDGQRSVAVEPLRPAPADGDYLALLERNLARLQQALGETAPAASP